MAWTKPSPQQKALVDEATYLRGRIISSYAQLEFLLADLSVKLDLRFPYLIKDRIKAAKKIAERPGYEVYKDELNKLCDDFLQYDETRNFMVHGFLMLITDKSNNHVFEMRRYQRSGDGKFERVEVETNISKMLAIADEITAHVQKAIRLLSRIYLEKRLEHPADGILTEWERLK